MSRQLNKRACVFRCTEALVALALLAGCAMTGPDSLNFVTDTTTPIERNGFTMLPPGGNGWMAAPSGPYGARFGKPVMNTDGTRASIAVMVWAGRYTDRKFDLQTAKGLREAAEYTAETGDSRRFKVIEMKYSPVFRQQNTDCISYRGIVEERDNPMAWNAGQILTTDYDGLVCRHPSSPDYSVNVMISERRPQGQASVMDDALRKQIQTVKESVVFTPLKK